MEFKKMSNDYKEFNSYLNNDWVVVEELVDTIYMYKCIIEKDGKRIKVIIPR